MEKSHRPREAFIVSLIILLLFVAVMYLNSVFDLVLLYQLLHRSYKKQRKYSVFWLLGTAVKMGFSVTSKKATTYTGTFCPNL